MGEGSSREQGYKMTRALCPKKVGKGAKGLSGQRGVASWASRDPGNVYGWMDVELVDRDG